MSANDKQVGGEHYRRQKIQHWDLVVANNIPYLEARAIAYLMRWRDKGGVQDLHKAKHFVEKLIEVEELKAAEEVKPEPEPTDSWSEHHMLTPEFHRRVVTDSWGLGHWRYRGSGVWERTDGWVLPGVDVGYIPEQLKRYDNTHPRDKSKGGCGV